MTTKMMGIEPETLEEEIICFQKLNSMCVCLFARIENIAMLLATLELKLELNAVLQLNKISFVKCTMWCTRVNDLTMFLEINDIQIKHVAIAVALYI